MDGLRIEIGSLYYVNFLYFKHSINYQQDENAYKNQDF